MPDGSGGDAGGVTTSEKNDRKLRLIHLSDVHFGTEDAFALAAVERFIAGAKPAALIVSGDLTQRGRKREFSAAREWFDRIGIPAYVAPGNHDTPLLQLGARLTSPFARYRKHIGEYDIVDRLIELDDGAVRISAINTARGVQARRNWADGVVDMDDLDAALSLLAGGPPDAWRILVCHHPLIPPRIAKISVRTLRGEAALQRAAEAKVDAILTGHIHDAFAEPMPGVGRRMVQMGSGTLSTRLRTTPASFCILEIDGDHLSQDVVTIEPDTLRIERAFTTKARANGTGG